MVGLARCISGGVTIAYIQDILVDPEHHRKGIGRALVESCLKHFSELRQIVLLTDNRTEQQSS